MISEEELRRRAAEGSRKYWANITPEERAQRQQKSNATRQRNKEIDRERRAKEWERQARKEAAREKQRANRAAMTPAEKEAASAKRRAKALVEKESKRTGKTDHFVELIVPDWPKPIRFMVLSDHFVEKRSRKFWAYVDQSGGPNACWPWHGSRAHNDNGPTGYGIFYWAERSHVGAHRAAWMLHNGLQIPWDAPVEILVDHMCEIKWCENPYHLTPVTRAENNRRRYHREPEITRTATGVEPPWDDRWYPFGRRKYNDDGTLKPKYDPEHELYGVEEEESDWWGKGLFR